MDRMTVEEKKQGCWNVGVWIIFQTGFTHFKPVVNFFLDIVLKFEQSE